MKIIVDTLGVDNGEKELLEASIDVYKEKKIQFVFVGDKEKIEPIIKEEIDSNDYEIIDTLEYITNEDDPVRAIRNKKNSSMVLAFNRLNDYDCDGIISCGSTGALLASATFITGRMDNVKRASLAAMIPTLKGSALLIDTGANADVKASYLREFTIMGNVFVKEVYGRQTPSVKLLNIGVESHKGNKLAKETYELLSKEKEIQFDGNIEARDIFMGKADVIVTDGFSGNIALKSAEGMATVLMGLLKKSLGELDIDNNSLYMISKTIKKNLSTFDYKEVGGAPLLGIKKPVYKAHGNSDRRSFYNALIGLTNYVEKDVVSIIKEKLND